MIQETTQNTISQELPCLAVTGLDAAKFLQGQLTADVLALNISESIMSAYCNIKGKVESLQNIHRMQDKYILQMPSDLLEITYSELKKYAIFSKVELAIITHQFSIKSDLIEIEQKIPAVFANTSGKFFPHDLNLPALGAVSFSKGCYRGQEIVARMQHRGNLARHMQIFTSHCKNIAAGSNITTQDGKIAGTVVRVATNDSLTIGLAVISDIYLEQNLSILNATISVR